MKTALLNSITKKRKRGKPLNKAELAHLLGESYRLIQLKDQLIDELKNEIYSLRSKLGGVTQGGIVLPPGVRV